MAARVLFATAALLMALFAFCGAGPVPAGINLFGVLFLFFAYVIWFCWPIVREGFSRHRNGKAADLMIIRLAPILVRRPRREKSKKTSRA